MEAGSHSKEFLWSEAVIESLFGLALFMVSAKLIGHTSYDIVPFAIGGGVYGFIGYVLLIMLFNLFGSSLYEADEIPERMDILAAALALLLPAAMLIGAVIAILAVPFISKDKWLGSPKAR